MCLPWLRERSPAPFSAGEHREHLNSDLFAMATKLVLARGTLPQTPKSPLMFAPGLV